MSGLPCAIGLLFSEAHLRFLVWLRAITFLIFYKGTEEDKADMYGLPCAVGLHFSTAHLRFPSGDRSGSYRARDI